MVTAYANTDENGIPIPGMPVPGWGKKAPGYHVLAYLIKHGKVQKGVDGAAAVRRMLPILGQYPGDRFRTNYNNQHSYEAGGTLVCNEALIPPGLLKILKDGNSFKTQFAGMRPPNEEEDVKAAKQSKFAVPFRCVSFLSAPV